MMMRSKIISLYISCPTWVSQHYERQSNTKRDTATEQTQRDRKSTYKHKERQSKRKNTESKIVTERHRDRKIESQNEKEQARVRKRG